MSRHYISMVEKTDARYHRSEIILHRPDLFYEAEFKRMEQLVEFSRMMGFTFKLRRDEPSVMYGRYQEFDLSHEFDDKIGGGFWKLDDLPEGARPFLGLSNGSIVTCYFVNDGQTITIYRPNPNAKVVYHPLTTMEHIGHQARFGVY